MLHIGLDGSRIAKDKYTGTEQYSHTIYEHLFRVAPHHRYTVYAPKMPSKPLDTGRAAVDYRIIPFPRLWTQLRLSWEFATRPRPDVLFVPSHTVPLVHPKAVVNTVHDLGFKRYPAYYKPGERLYQNLGLWLATRMSREIIAISDATKEDLLRYTKFPAANIHVIHHGVDPERFFPRLATDTPPKRLRELQPYFFYLGRLEAKKNIVRLIQAFRSLKERTDVPHRLVLAGKPGMHGFDEIIAALEQLPEGIRSQVVLPGYVSDHDYPIWLRFADALTFPTGFEGFGLPALEAMASGVPAIVSRNSSLPEIVGDAGVLVNETKADAIAEAMRKLATDPALRHQLAQKGLQRARQFTWERAARQTIGVLEHAAQQAAAAT